MVVLFFKNVMFRRTARMYFYQNQYRDVQTAVRLPEGSNVLVRNNTVDLAEGKPRSSNKVHVDLVFDQVF